MGLYAKGCESKVPSSLALMVNTLQTALKNFSIVTQGGSLNLKNNVIWRPPPSRFISVHPSFSTISTKLFNRPGVAGDVLQTPLLLIN